MDVDRDAYEDLLSLARRCTRTLEEARDVTQESLLAALARGFGDWSAPTRRAWLHGVVRKRAALLARGEGRRRRRERSVPEAEAGPEAWRWQPHFLDSLSPSLRALAALASADLGAKEVRWLLDLSDTALRQRLTALRRALRSEPESPVVPSPGPPGSFGPQRAALLASLRRQPGRALATRDPDGHAILFCVAAHGTPGSGNS
jgi:DNA-directed RNA polymerase specialized sigma24 family protein